MKDAPKVLFLITGCLIVGFCALYELVELCLDIGISPWLGVTVMAALYALFLYRECREASHG